MNLLPSRDPTLLKELTCCCGKPAELMWHLPLEKPTEKRVKLSKTQLPPEELVPKKIQPYGWACNAHIPAGVEVAT